MSQHPDDSIASSILQQTPAPQQDVRKETSRDCAGILKLFRRIADKAPPALVALSKRCTARSSARRRKEALRARRVLILCSRNEIRSFTAERLYRKSPGIEVRSAGTHPDARIQVSASLVKWADEIYAMETGHTAYLRLHFSSCLNGKRIVVLGIPDVHAFMSRGLVSELDKRLRPHLDTPGPAAPTAEC